MAVFAQAVWRFATGQSIILVDVPAGTKPFDGPYLMKSKTGLQTHLSLAGEAEGRAEQISTLSRAASESWLGSAPEQQSCGS